MSKLPLPEAHWGYVGKPRLNWRDVEIDEGPDEDDESAPTPPDVIAMLGFDPKEIAAESLAEDEEPGATDPCSLK